MRSWRWWLVVARRLAAARRGGRERDPGGSRVFRRVARDSRRSIFRVRSPCLSTRVLRRIVSRQSVDLLKTTLPGVVFRRVVSRPFVYLHSIHPSVRAVYLVEFDGPDARRARRHERAVGCDLLRARDIKVAPHAARHHVVDVRAADVEVVVPAARACANRSHARVGPTASSRRARKRRRAGQRRRCARSHTGSAVARRASRRSREAWRNASDAR